MRVGVAAGLDIAVCKEIPRYLQTLGRTVPRWIDIANDRRHRYGKIRKGFNDLFHDDVRRKLALRPIRYDLRNVPPAIPIDLAVENASSNQCCRVRFGYIISRESGPEKFEGVDVPQAAVGLHGGVMDEVSGNVAAFFPDRDQHVVRIRIVRSPDGEIGLYAGIDGLHACEARQHAGQGALELNHARVLGHHLPIVGDSGPEVCALESQLRPEAIDVHQGCQAVFEVANDTQISEDDEFLARVDRCFTPSQKSYGVSHRIVAEPRKDAAYVPHLV